MQNKTSPKSRKEYEDNIQYDKIGSGRPEKEGTIKDGISVKSLRNMPKSTYSFMADPYDPALPTSRPYGILNGFNKTVGAWYGGVRNLDGGNVQQYPNSIKSKFLKYFDFARMKFKMQYHYIPSEYASNITKPATDNYPGRALINEQIRAIAEAISQLKSTTFTQMAIYDYAVATDMPMGDAYKTTNPTYTTEDGKSIYVYEDLTHVIYAISRYYQTFWLRLDGMLNWLNSFRLKMGTMIRSSWNRETPALNSLFGLFKKKSFLSLIDSLGMAFPGEYIDREFAVQIAKTCTTPSRRTDSITDPVLEVQTVIEMPKHFALLLKNSEHEYDETDAIFDNMRDLTQPLPGSVGTYITYEQAIDNIMDNMSAEDTMYWARSIQYEPGADTARFNYVKYRLDVIQKCVTLFKTVINDYREALDTTSRAGLVTWFKGYRPSITKDTDAALFRNLVVDDIYRMAMGGAVSVTMDPDTKRWRTYSVWNMYDGIPEYDAWSGGAFLTFSIKAVNDADDADGIINYVPQALIQYLEDIGTQKQKHWCRLTSRDGLRVFVQPAAFTMNGNDVLDRLAPLPSQSQLQIRLAQFDGTATEITTTHRSTLIKTLTQIFGMCSISHAEPTVPEVFIDPDTLAIYQVEIEDITNEMIRYARIYSPFKGTVENIPQVGFLGTIARGNDRAKEAAIIQG